MPSRDNIGVIDTMRYLAIGDIHGCMTALSALEAYVPFTPTDTLVTLGDYVDRGPHSRAVVDWAIARTEKGLLIPLRGNHEVMMCAARESRHHFVAWFTYGGEATLKSYGTSIHKDALQAVPERHWHFMLNDCRTHFETDTHFFVHASVNPKKSLGEQPESMLYWEKFNNPAPHQSGKKMICGHTPQPSERPLNIGHAICIDTGATYGGWLTCLDVKSGKYWQANEQRDVRSGWLESRGTASGQASP